jgi:hypothetical protein
MTIAPTTTYHISCASYQRALLILSPLILKTTLWGRHHSYLHFTEVETKDWKVVFFLLCYHLPTYIIKRVWIKEIDGKMKWTWETQKMFLELCFVGVNFTKNKRQPHFIYPKALSSFSKCITKMNEEINNSNTLGDVVIIPILLKNFSSVKIP